LLGTASKRSVSGYHVHSISIDRQTHIMQDYFSLNFDTRDVVYACPIGH
jgi:hypothetical protein